MKKQKRMNVNRKFNADKWSQIIAHAAFGLLLVFSLVWMYARVFYIDSAYQLFTLINSGTFSVNDGRYAMVLSQLLPLLCLKLHLPLSVIVAAYSLSFVFWAYMAYLIVRYVLKDGRTALAMVCVFLCMRHTFMHCISETFQLMFFSFLLYALLAYKGVRKTYGSRMGYVFALLAVAAFCVFIHPVAIFFVAFILLYVWVDENFHLRKELFLFLGISVLLLAVKFLIPSEGGHDATFLLPLPELIAKLPDFLHFGSLHFFVDHFFDFYYFPILCFLWTSVFYIRRKKAWKAVLYIGFNLCFFFITLWIYYAGDGPIGMERSFLPMVFFTALPFVREVLPECRPRLQRIAFIVWILLLSHSMLRIAMKAEDYEKRLERMDYVLNVAKEQGICKVMVEKQLSETLGIGYNWGAGIESLMYSAVKHGGEACGNLFVYSNIEDMRTQEFTTMDSFAFVPWWRYLKHSDLNADYFPLKEAPYYLLKVEDGKWRFEQAK